MGFENGGVRADTGSGGPPVARGCQSKRLAELSMRAEDLSERSSDIGRAI